MKIKRKQEIEESERKRETWRGREKFDRRGKLPWKRVVLSHPDTRIGIYRNIVIRVYTRLHSIYIHRNVTWCKWRAFVWEVIFYETISRLGLRYNMSRD